MFFEKIKLLMNERKITMNKLAKEAGISQTSVDRYKNGSLPNADALIKICRYFQVSADYLLDLNNEAPPPQLSDQEKQLIDYFRECDSGTRKNIMILATSGAAESKNQEISSTSRNIG